MSPLLISFALVLAPAAPPPVAAATAPAPGPAAAPAPGPVAAPAPGPVAAPAPVAAGVATAPAPAPAAAVVAAGPPPTATATSNTTVVPAGTSVTVNVYPPAPAPAPAPVAAAPVVAPVVTPTVMHVTSPKPNPAMVAESIRKFRRGGIGVMAIGGVGMGVALALQWARVSALNDCRNDNRAAGSDEYYGSDLSCSDAQDLEFVGGYYSAIGMGVFVGAMAGGGAMFGKAAAHRDVQQRNGAFRSRRGAKLLGIASIIGGTAWMIGANWTLLQKEAQCDGSADCLLKYRPLRYAANDAGALGIGAGSALLGYGIAYDKQGRALMKLRAAPTLSRTTAGVSLTGRF